MRKFVLFGIFILLLATYVYAAAPTTEEEGMIIFDTQGQTTSQPYTVWNIAWSSSDAGYIATGNSMTISDAGSGTVIATTIADSVHTEYNKSFPNGIKTNGLTATRLTAGKGKIYVNANKR